MNTLRIEIKLLSQSLIGSGEGFGAVIDSDIVFDELGIPMIPAKRIKGCLRDSAKEIANMFDQAQISFKPAINDIFGYKGLQAGKAYFSNLNIAEYHANKEWLGYLCSEHDSILSKEAIINACTAIRQHTAIDEDGIAKDASLRTIRVVKTGMTFSGEIQFETGLPPETRDTLALACQNLRHIGSKRNRGFGEVACTLFDAETNAEISVLNTLEGLCTA